MFQAIKLILPAAGFLLYLKKLRGCPPPGISSSTHGMKMKPTLEVLLDQRC